MEATEAVICVVGHCKRRKMYEDADLDCESMKNVCARRLGTYCCAENMHSE